MRVLTRLTIVLLILMTLSIVTRPAYAGDATVTDCSNFIGAGTISQAMTIANSGGGTITFACSGVITFDNELIINANIILNSNGNNIAFTEVGFDNRFFSVNPSYSLTLNGFTLENGEESDAGAINNAGTLIINNSTFRNNSARSSIGGAIVNNGTLTITNSSFFNSWALVNGGAIANNGTLTITNTTFNYNSSAVGGAIYTTSGIVTINTSTFTNNDANQGGAINSQGGDVTVNNSLFDSNIVLVEGGAIYNLSGTFVINNSQLTNNFAGSQGSAIRSTSPNTRSQDNHYENNNCSGTIADFGGNTVTNSPNCPGSAPITLDVSALSCNHDSAVFTINAGDGDFNITGAGAGLPINPAAAGLYGLVGPATWTNITITELRGDRQSINIGGITCPGAVIIPPSVPVVTSTATVLGCALDVTDGVDIANAPDNTYCRILMKNGAVVSYSGAIPADLISLGVILAVDVYRLEGGMSQNTFPDYARICLARQGRLFYMDGRNAPRYSVEMPTEQVDGLTCAWIPAPGTVILTN